MYETLSITFVTTEHSINQLADNEVQAAAPKHQDWLACRVQTHGGAAHGLRERSFHNLPGLSLLCFSF